MRDILLQVSGAVAILAALIHGVLSETKIFPRVTIEPQRLHWHIQDLILIEQGKPRLLSGKFPTDQAFVIN